MQRMNKTAVKIHIEKPVFENPRMTAMLTDFDWKLDTGDAKGARMAVSGCAGRGARLLVDYAIERLEAVGAAAQADALKKERKGLAADAEPPPATSPADKFKEVFRLFSKR